ncbi:MAG: polysaccharide deacetylase family protein [Bacillota bacterium]|nr:polysaccharide deacetylase family protein [Candidatus Fermentithermobacillaceae bacterium]
MRKAVPYITGLAVVLVLVVLAYRASPELRGSGPLDPTPLKGGNEKDNRAIGESDLEKLYPGLVLRAYKGPEKIVALTFDDGPDEVYTPQVLDILREKGVRATFFLLGSRIDENPEVAKRILDEGHSIGNHTYSHPKLVAASPELPQELEKCREAMARLGIGDNGFFRPPYGAAEPSLVEQARDLGYRVAMWSIDSLDWRGLSRAEVMRNIKGYVEPGSVILQHSAGGPGEDLSGSVLAVGDIIDLLTGQGYRFVTLPEMFPSPEKSP